MSILERVGMYSIGLFTKDPKQILAYYRLDLNDFTKKNVIFTVLGSLLFLFTIILTKSNTLLLPLPLLGGLLFIGLMNRPSLRYSRIMGAIEEHTDLIYNELATVKIYSNSIIDAIIFIASGFYPILSKELEAILHRVQLGASPEQEIKAMLVRYPSQILIEGWGLFLDQQEISEKNLQINQELAQQIALNRFEEQTSQLETRIMVFVGLSLFVIPMYQIISSIIGWAWIPIVVIVPLGSILLLLEAALFNRLTIGRLTTSSKEIRGAIHERRGSN